MRLSIEQMRMLEELSPLAKEIGAKINWRRMAEEELREKLSRLHSLIGELLQSLGPERRTAKRWIARNDSPRSEAHEA